MPTYRYRVRPEESLDKTIAVVAFDEKANEAEVERIVRAFIDDALAETAAGRDVVWPWIGRFRRRTIKAVARRATRMGTIASYPAREAIGYVPAKLAKDVCKYAIGFIEPDWVKL